MQASIDKCKEENGGPYKASIPLSQATNPVADALLTYEMNGEEYPVYFAFTETIGCGSLTSSE
ncbi:sulfite oxidase [Sarracenia purpurea var. burkii]